MRLKLKQIHFKYIFRWSSFTTDFARSGYMYQRKAQNCLVLTFYKPSYLIYISTHLKYPTTLSRLLVFEYFVTKHLQILMLNTHFIPHNCALTC